MSSCVSSEPVFRRPVGKSMQMVRLFFAIALFVFLTNSVSLAQSSPPDSTAVRADSLRLPSNALARIELLDFKNADLKDVVRGLAAKYNLNVFVDNAVNRRITIRLADLRVIDALRFLIKEHDLRLTLSDGVFRIFPPPEPEPVVPPVSVSVENGLLSVDFNDVDVGRVIRLIAERSGESLLVGRGVEGKISGFLQNVPFERGLQSLFASNSFQLREKDGVFSIERQTFSGEEKGDARRNLWISIEDSLITLDVSGVPLGRIIREISAQSNLDFFIYGKIEGLVTARCHRASLANALNYLFKGTKYTWRREGRVVFVGNREVAGIASMKLIRLEHIKADGVLELLPRELTEQANIEVVKEHNGVMIVGAREVIHELETFMREIDHPIAQIFFEVLVVDYLRSSISDYGITVGESKEAAPQSAANFYYPFIDGVYSANRANKALDKIASAFGLAKIVTLPDDFFVQIHALSQAGRAKIRSQPQIATLSGHPANIKIGTTQYYLLETENPVVGANQVFNQVSQRFETISADISLTVTPWVSAGGEITVEIQPEFNTPQGQLDPNIPPTINSRSLNSTVKLRDGETIILGGLQETVESLTISKLPVLGSIPLLGRVFQNRKKEKQQTDLIIYITPHLYFPGKGNYMPEGVIK